MSGVLVITNDFPTRRGGIETFVLSLCEGMDPADVVVYTASMPGDEEYDRTLPFPVYRDPSSTLLPTRAVARRTIEVMRRHQCDRVVFGASAPLGLIAARLRTAGAQRIVALTHGHEVWWARVPLSRQLLRRIGDSVDVMTYVSEWCRRQIAPALSAAAASRMQRLSPRVDANRFYPGNGGAEVRRRLGISAHAPVVVCTARMVRRKGQDTLVRGWPDLLRSVPDARLVLVGDGPNRRHVERMAKKRALGSSVIFTGSVPWADMPGYTDAGDVFAMPCRTRRFGLEAEAFGIVLLEAAACALPVVAGDSGGASETVVEGVTGFVVRGRHTSEVVARLVEVLTGPELSDRLGRRGLDRASGVQQGSDLAGLVGLER